jgi:hypothetical protein
VRHSWTPEAIQSALRFGTEIASCRRAAESFEDATKIPLSKSSLQALLLEYGGRLAALEEQAALQAVETPSAEEVQRREGPEPDSEVMAVGLEGVLVNMRGEGWKEVKLETREGEEPQVQLGQHSYCAGLWEAAVFAKHQWAEACRRGLEKARKVVRVSDAAAWIWAIVLTCYAPCIEIIAWWHALPKLWQTAGKLWDTDPERAKAWVPQLELWLWAGDVRGLLQVIRRSTPRGTPLAEPLQQLLGYLYRQRRRLRYKVFRQAGYPIGSGTTESACKVVVKERMAQAGMRWSREGAQAMLALRSVLPSRRWHTTWRALCPAPKPA